MNKIKRFGLTGVSGKALRLIACLMAAVTVFALSGCGAKSDGEKTETAASETETKEDFGAAYAGYLEYIKEKKSQIDDYASSKETERGPMRSIAVTDICGDSTPELICVYNGDKNGEVSATLEIVSFEDGKVKTLFKKKTWDSVVAGAMNSYYFYKEKGKKTLYAYSRYGDETVITCYSQFKENKDKLDLEEMYRHAVVYYFEDVNGEETRASEDSYGKNGSQEITEKQFDKAVSKIKDNLSDIIMITPDVDDFAAEYAVENGEQAMTADEAEEYLKKKAGGDTSEKNGKEKETESDDDAFAYFAGNYSFYSGAGGWSTDIELKSDGTFTGTYHDTDYPADETGGYSVELALSVFSGSFTKLKKVNAYTYSAKIKSITYDTEIGKEEIKKWEGRMCKYSYTEAYGLSGGKTFYFYKKGTALSKLPEGYVSWIRMSCMVDEGETKLPCNGIYNEHEEYGFIGYDE